MSLEVLQEVLPSSTIPAETGVDENWVQVERILGTGLPPDYKDYINAYGSAIIKYVNDLYILPFNPFSAQLHRNLLRQMAAKLESLRELKSYRESFSFPLYPEPQGLLPWGESGDGDGLYWQMIGEPIHWPVVLIGARWGPGEQFAESMTSFLTRLLSGTLESEIFGNFEPSAVDDEDSSSAAR